MVGGVVSLIPVLDGQQSNQQQKQRAEIARVVKRWGPLVDAIGGRDPIETVCVLQVRTIPNEIPYICLSRLLIYFLSY